MLLSQQERDRISIGDMYFITYKDEEVPIIILSNEKYENYDASYKDQRIFEVFCTDIGILNLSILVDIFGDHRFFTDIIMCNELYDFLLVPQLDGSLNVI